MLSKWLVFLRIGTRMWLKTKRKIANNQFEIFLMVGDKRNVARPPSNEPAKETKHQQESACDEGTVADYIKLWCGLCPGYKPKCEKYWN